MRVEVIQRPATFHHPMILNLSREQASPRMHNLKAMKGDRYQVVNDVEFKVGEILGVEGKMSKEQFTGLIELDAKKET